MTAETAWQPAPAGLLGKLMAVVRPQFRVDVYLPDPHDAVLGCPVCLVPGCDRSAGEHRLCSAHARRWRAVGCPDLPMLFADPGPPLPGRIELTACSVDGCRYGVNGLGLCMRHRDRWSHSGHPDPAAWAATVPTVVEPEHRQCGLPFCTLWVHSDNLFCKAHHTRWCQLGRPVVADYITHCLDRGKVRIHFSSAAAQLKLEFQYAVQCRVDQQSIITPVAVVNWAIRLTADAGVSSLLDHDEQQWRALTATSSANKPGTSYEGFLLHARTVVEFLAEGTGWEVEYGRDIWRLHTLPGLTLSPGKTENARNNLRSTESASRGCGNWPNGGPGSGYSPGCRSAPLSPTLPWSEGSAGSWTNTAGTSIRWAASIARCWNGIWRGWPGRAPARHSERTL